MSVIGRALISVYDKTGVMALAKSLAASEFEIISTGGTARMLRGEGVSVTELSDHTGFPEILDGRVKTLHPKVHGGLLYIRGNREHEGAVSEHGILPIDIVVVNLYPFEQAAARTEATESEIIENIDIGGPSMIRSAAKNFQHVTIVVDPMDYAELSDQVHEGRGTSLEFRRRMARKAFARTASYDRAIANHFERAVSQTADLTAKEESLPTELRIDTPRVQPLRYGENPHQRAGLYGQFSEHFEQLHGKALSYNNILDLTAATHLIAEFSGDRPTLAILKHTNPCGVGQGANLREAWDKAFATDQQAPFGGIIATNQPIDKECAEAISEIFSEVIIAPGFEEDARQQLTKKKNLRLIRLKRELGSSADWDLRSVGFYSYLLQDRDTKRVAPDEWQSVTQRAPTEKERRAMWFGWRVVKHIKSNAILYAGPDRTLGIGAGQMSRVDASRIAIMKAKDAVLPLEGSVVCSDAFFPFPDGLISAIEGGASAAIQPGGSVRDQEIIQAADARNLAMCFTGVRHFRH